MTYSDNNPERRNLTVLSLAIILYYLGEGYLINPEISFTLINIGFKNKEILVVAVWFMLLWFLFRYVVTNRHAHGVELDNSKLMVNMDYAPVRTYLIKHGTNINDKDIKLSTTVIGTPSHSKWYIGFPDYRRVLTGLDGYLIIKLYLLKTAFKHRATTDYYTPYIVFFIAVSMGIHHNVMNVSAMLPVLAVFITVMVVEVLYYIRD